MSANIAVYGKTESKSQTAGMSPRRLARIAGLLYLIIIAAGIFAEFFVRQSLKVPGDPAATASNIMASAGLLRAGIAADWLMIFADVTLALVFYVLFKPVSRSLSLLAAFFRLAQATVLGLNLLNLFFALQLVSSGYLAALGMEQQQAMSLMFFEAHATGYSLALLFFGVNLLILGYLVFKSGYFPRILGFLLIAAALGYLIDGFAKILLPNYGALEATFTAVVFVPAFIAELVLCLWLLIKGVNVSQQDENLQKTTAPGA
ncbi:MAG: DUF4386 domain-containing protein [Candidatus Promineifilaceae bacterium]|nr:DUF4386 domain-containing protein [Candidatus Promineifilaceae bacterium]